VPVSKDARMMKRVVGGNMIIVSNRRKKIEASDGVTLWMETLRMD